MTTDTKKVAVAGEVFDFDDDKGAWFPYLGNGARVQIRVIPASVLKDINRKSLKKRKVEYAQVEGRAERFPVEEYDDEMRDQLFWDYVIMDWELLLDKNGKEIPKTAEFKLKLMQKSAKFARFVSECLKKLSDDEAEIEEEKTKN